MFAIKHYSKYVHNGSKVYSKERLFPLIPDVHKTKKYDRYFMVSDSGVASFVSLKNILAFTESVSSKSRRKTIVHKLSGRKFQTMKAACEAFGISTQHLKSSPDFDII